MRHLALSIIPIFILSVGIASCSHSHFPFLDKLGINTDSILIDSFPSKDPYLYSGQLLRSNSLSIDQTKELTDFECQGTIHDSTYVSNIVSAKQFNDNYLITLRIYNGEMRSLLFNREGKKLDECLCGYNNARVNTSIAKVYRKIPNANFYVYTNPWEHHYVGNDKLSATFIDNEHGNKITYLYRIANDKIILISRKSKKNVLTPSLDIAMYPTSQMYEVCNIIAKSKIEYNCPYIVTTGWCGTGTVDEDSIDTVLYPKNIIQPINSNLPVMLKWIVDNKQDSCVANCLRYICSDKYKNSCYGKFSKNITYKSVKNQIMQIKDKKSQQYLLMKIIY